MEAEVTFEENEACRKCEWLEICRAAEAPRRTSCWIRVCREYWAKELGGTENGANC